MPIKKNIKKATYIFFGFLVFFLILVVLKNWYGNEAPPEGKEIFTITHTTEAKTGLPEQWRYDVGDNMQWALPSFNDSAWQHINPKLNPDSLPANFFNSVIWFRCYFLIAPSLINKVVALNLIHYGASEIYLDGKLLKKYGKVSVNPKSEKGKIPDLPVIFSLPDTNKHLLAIRYSNHRAIEYYKKYEEDLEQLEEDKKEMRQRNQKRLPGVEIQPETEEMQLKRDEFQPKSEGIQSQMAEV